MTIPQRTPALSRRAFLGSGALAGLGLALAGCTDQVFGNGTAVVQTTGYGPLVPDPAGVLDLPAGFSYRIVAESGVTTLETGEPTPSDPDGSAAFPRPGGGSVLVYNHEVSGDEAHPVPAHPEVTYDPGAGGGTTTLEVDAAGNRVRERVSLAGTSTNCAGGVTPWDTWLSCEETEAVPGSRNSLRERHGYVFEVDPYDQERNRDPRPIRALGRFAHEAVVVDPEEGRLYLTEDADDPVGLLYRWTPPASALPLGRESLRQLGDTDGALEALRATRGGEHVRDLSEATEVGTTYDVEWVAVPDRDATRQSTREQDYDRPVTRGRKLEGAWWGNGGAYVVSSYARAEDGSATPHDGQVWFLDPRADTLRLTLHFAWTPRDDSGGGGDDRGQDETPTEDPDGPDNITVSPYGGVVIAEDGGGASHLLGATPEGAVFPMARAAGSGAEFTGPTFSRDQRTLFANLQGDGSPDSPGYVFAITGPFRQLT